MKKWKEHRENLSNATRVIYTYSKYTWNLLNLSFVFYCMFFLLVLRNLAFLSISSGFITQSLTLKIVTYFYNSTSVSASYLKLTNCNIITHILMFFKHENKISIGNYTAQNLFRCCPYISTHWTYITLIQYIEYTLAIISHKPLQTTWNIIRIAYTIAYIIH